MYWTGIRQFGLIKTSLSLQGFCRKFANPDQPLRDLVDGSDKTKGDDPDAADQANETINGPPYDDDWIDELTVYLSQVEATFLSRQIEARVPLSLLGQLLLDSDVRRKFLDLPSDWNFTSFADDAPFVDRFPEGLQRIIAAARDFWQLMYGAHIRYNCLLQDRHGTSELREKFEATWNEWREELQSFHWERWNTECLWELTTLHHRKVRPTTITFVESWIDDLRSGVSADKLDPLVRLQERNNKRNRARLLPTANESISKWVGIDDLNYRLNVARTIIRDIDDGLTASEDDDAGL